MQIVDFIQYGHDNAITRESLCILTGFTDREVRDAINKSEDLIINLGDGRGYFKPLPEEEHLVTTWERVFWKRIRDEMDRVNKAKGWKEIIHGQSNV